MQPAGRDIKCVIIGDGAVGKTCLLFRHVTGRFPKGYQPTICDTYSLKITYRDQPFVLKIFDTAGQEGFENLRVHSYHEANVFLLCFAVDNRDSFENIGKWKNDVSRAAPTAPIILVGCQSDKRLRQGNVATLAGQVVLPNEGYKAAAQIGAKAYLECSAHSGDGITAVFNKAIEVGSGLSTEQKSCPCTIL